MSFYIKLLFHLKNVFQSFRSFMFSSEIEVSYFAAGIAAHLASDENIDWSKVVIDKNQIIKELVRPRLIMKFS